MHIPFIHNVDFKLDVAVNIDYLLNDARRDKAVQNLHFFYLSY